MNDVNHISTISCEVFHTSSILRTKFRRFFPCFPDPLSEHGGIASDLRGLPLHHRCFHLHRSRIFFLPFFSFQFVSLSLIVHVYSPWFSETPNCGESSVFTSCFAHFHLFSVHLPFLHFGFSTRKTWLIKLSVHSEERNLDIASVVRINEEAGNFCGQLKSNLSTFHQTSMRNVWISKLLLNWKSWCKDTGHSGNATPPRPSLFF